MKIPFWERVFKKDDEFLFGSEPNKTILEFENQFDKNWTILDVGCGDGKNSIYLAQKGYKSIDAFDVSEGALEKVNRICSKQNLNINTQKTSLQNFKFEKQYDLVISLGVFHFVKKEEWKEFIAEAQKNTKIGGMHIVQLFNDNIAPTPDIAPYAVGMSKDGEIKELYKDWEIKQFLSYEFEEKHPDVPLHKHASNKLVAVKIR